MKLSDGGMRAMETCMKNVVWELVQGVKCGVV